MTETMTEDDLAAAHALGHFRAMHGHASSNSGSSNNENAAAARERRRKGKGPKKW